MPEVSTHRILVTSLVYKVRGWYSASSRRKCFISRKNDLLPVKPRDGSLLPLSPKRTQVRLKSLLYLVWLTPESTPNPRTSFGQECRLRLKRPAPNAARRCPPFKSSTPESFRGSCSCGLFPWVALLRFAFGRRIWHTIFFSSKANFKIFPKPRLASPFLRDSPGTVHPRYPAWNTSLCRSVKSPSQ